VNGVSAWRVSAISAFAVLVCIGFGALELIHPLAYVRLCNLFGDAIARSGRTTVSNPDLVFLAIDAQSIGFDETDIQSYHLSNDDSGETRALRLISKGWPWSREVYAAVLDRLTNAGARVVVFDLNFPTPTVNDPAFRAALDRHADHVVIASNFNFLDKSLVRPCETLIPQTSRNDSRVGFANFWPDDDEVVRRGQYRVSFNDFRETGRSESGAAQFLSLAGAALAKAGFASSIPDGDEPHLFRFTASPQHGFPPHSLFEIFVPDFWRHNYQSGEFFRDKIVIVGAEGSWQHDEHPTSFGEMPGPELQLNAINAAIHHEFIAESPPLANLIGICIAAFIAVIMALLCRNVWLRSILILFIAGASVLCSLFCFNRASLYLPIIAPLAVFGFTTLIALICDFASERKERRRVRRVLERYVSRDVVHELVDHPDVYRDSLGGVTKPVAILFSDIRAYSKVTASTSPETLVAQLNEYFSAMVDCVFENNGTLDKFIGDALMASWGSLHSRGGRADAVAAVRAALAMKERLRSLNKVWQQRGWPDLRVGMAINYGDVVVGNIGSPQRMEFTLIGDAVNVSWKLQELTKTKPADLIVTESVASLIGEHFEVRSLGLATVGGSHQPCEIFSVGEITEVAPSNDRIRNESWHAGAAFGPPKLSSAFTVGGSNAISQKD
jgi:adenylate cyclase